MLFYNIKPIWNSCYESIFKSLKSVCLQFWRPLKFLEEITLIRQRMSLQQNVWGKHLNWVKVLHCFCFVTFSFCSDNVCLLCASRMYFMIMETIFIGSAERPPNPQCQHNTNYEMFFEEEKTVPQTAQMGTWPLKEKLGAINKYLGILWAKPELASLDKGYRTMTMVIIILILSNKSAKLRFYSKRGNNNLASKVTSIILCMTVCH